jgi:hypothetical protein
MWCKRSVAGATPFRVRRHLATAPDEALADAGSGRNATFSAVSLKVIFGESAIAPYLGLATHRTTPSVNDGDPRSSTA